MTKQDLQNIFRQSYKLEVWQDVLIKLFGARDIRRIPAELESDNCDKIQGYQLGELNTSDNYSIGLFAFEIKDSTKIGLNKVGLRSLVRSYIKYGYDAALAVYYNREQWRLSFICDLKGENTAPKKYTYVFGNQNESYRTAIDRLLKIDGIASFANIYEAFSVEKLSKEFFKEYKLQYSKFIAYLGDTKSNRDYVKKMLGRLVFLQFLQKKGWLGVPSSCTDWKGGDTQYTNNLIKQYKGCDTLLTDVLEVLFFDTLNAKREGDLADSRLGENIKIPYLNGGLFDKDTLDKKKIDFPYTYFEELMEFFAQYNFTIDENDPYDAEVGIDPEMLGHIFENLLEDNKDKGAFYTPKEIVQYMCRQSLIEYLQSKLGKHDEISRFVNHHDVGDRKQQDNFIIANAEEIENLLDTIKICDPAIGSGAFPMGILSEIFHCKMALDLTLNRAEVKKGIIQNSIYGVDIEQGAVDIARLRFWLSLVVEENEPQPLPNLDYKIMCGNSLLSRHALDTPIKDVFASYNEGKRKDERFTLDDYKALVAEYTNTSNKDTKNNFREKIEKIKSAFKTTLDAGKIQKRRNLEYKAKALRADTLFGAATKADINQAKEIEKKVAAMLKNEADVESNRLFENAFEWRFEFPALLDDNGDFMGFDIVIGNPPYVSVKALNDIFKKLMASIYISGQGRFNLFTLFIEKGYDILKKEGVLTYIIPEGIYSNIEYRFSRKLLLDNTIKKLCLFSGRVFDASIDTTIICFAKSKNEDNKFGIDRDLINTDIFLNQNDIVKFPYNVFPVKLDSKNISIITKAVLSNKYDRFKCCIEIQQGIIYTGQNKEDIFSNIILNSTYKKCLDGRDVTKWRINWDKKEENKYISYTSKLHRAREERLFIADSKILIPRRATTLYGCIDSDKFYALNTAYILLNRRNNEYVMEYYLSLINSKYINYIYNQLFFGWQITIPALEIMPIAKISIQEQIQYVELVNEILEQKRENPKADTSALEAEIDKMVYKLYDLTEEEIAIIENK